MQASVDPLPHRGHFQERPGREVVGGEIVSVDSVRDGFGNVLSQLQYIRRRLKPIQPLLEHREAVHYSLPLNVAFSTSISAFASASSTSTGVCSRWKYAL